MFRTLLIGAMLAAAAVHARSVRDELGAVEVCELACRRLFSAVNDIYQNWRDSDLKRIDMKRIVENGCILSSPSVGIPEVCFRVGQQIDQVVTVLERDIHTIGRGNIRAQDICVDSTIQLC